MQVFQRLQARTVAHARVRAGRCARGIGITRGGRLRQRRRAAATRTRARARAPASSRPRRSSKAVRRPKPSASIPRPLSTRRTSIVNSRGRA
jgi:hypothetical protein